MVVERHARRRREIRQVVLAERDRQIAALRDRDAFASASGRSANAAAISACVLKYCSGVKRRGPPRVGEHVALGDADARLVRAKILAAQELHRMRRDHRQARARRRAARWRRPARRRRGGPRAAPRGSSARGRARPRRARPSRRPAGVALQQRVADVAVARAGKRDQPVGAFVEPLAPAARRGRDTGCRGRRASAIPRAADSRRATARAAARETAGRARPSCVIQTSQPKIGLMPRARAAL